MDPTAVAIHPAVRNPFSPSALLAWALCFLPAVSVASASISPATPPGKLIAQAGQVMSSDKTRFQQLLRQLHREEHALTPEQRQQLAYLDAWEADMSGHGPRAIRLYKSVIEHARNPVLVTKARAGLIYRDLRSRNYLEAYAMNNLLMAELPKVTDATIRRRILNTIIRVLFSENQFRQVLHYVHKLSALGGSIKDRCTADLLGTQARFRLGSTMAATATEYRNTVNTCLQAGMLGHANTIRLDRASMMIDEGKNLQAVRFLQTIAPDIHKAGFRIHIASLHVTTALAYLKQGDFAQARTAAHKAIAINSPGSHNYTLQLAYQVLYQAAEHTGDTRAALRDYIQYVDQENAASDDARAQSLAYQVVKQQVLENQLRYASLSKDHRILQLRQQLDRKKAETSRLYVLLLFIVLAILGIWAYRTKHLQLRFRHLARKDSLTGAMNRSYFLEQAGRILDRLHKSGSPASFLILDLDHFKGINDRFGHLGGDVVLSHVAAACRNELRESDLFGRLGGEEFGILMPGCPADAGADVGKRILNALARTSVQVNDAMDVTVTASIGLACTEDFGHDLHALLIQADAAQYQAKRSGRNRLVTSGVLAPVAAS